MKPGRFLTWDNSVYTHIVFPGKEMREMVGPVAFKDASAHMVSQGCDVTVYSFQAFPDRLVVTPGSLLRIHADVIFQDWPSSCAEGEPVDEVNIFCTTLTPIKRALNTQNPNTETKFKKASLSPNTYNVSQSYTVQHIFNKNDRAHPLFSFSAYPHPTAQGPGHGGKQG